jgi:hypothetical protein
MLPDTPVETGKIEDIITKLISQFEHCKPLPTCYFLKIEQEQMPLLYNELNEIANVLHNSAIAALHFVMNPVDFNDEFFQYQFLKNESACVKALFDMDDIIDDTPDNP